MRGSDSEMGDATPYKREREEWGERKEINNEILDKVPRDLNVYYIIPIRKIIARPNKKSPTIFQWLETRSGDGGGNNF